MNLSQRTVDALKPGKRRIVWDARLPRFGVSINQQSCAYVVDFGTGPRRRRVRIGPTAQIRFARQSSAPRRSWPAHGKVKISPSTRARTCRPSARSGGK